MRVVTSCSSRFHIFEQAMQLHKRGWLHRLIYGMPSLALRDTTIPPALGDPLLANFAFSLAHHKVSRFLPDGLESRCRGLTHNWFSRRVARRLPPGTDVFIGLSSLCLEALVEAKCRGIRAVVDHGSLHEITERDALRHDADRYGFMFRGNAAHAWLIEKERKEFEEANIVFVLSSVARRSLVANGVSPEKIFANCCGVSLQAFKPMPRQDSVFRFIHCSNLSPRKGLHYILKAFAALRCPHAELWIIGPTENIAADPTYHALVRQLAGPQVRFLGAHRRHELAALYSQGSAFVHPSLADGFGMVVPQAMACGLPVIVSDMTGAMDLVVENQNGFVVPAAETEVLADRMEQMYRDPVRTAEMGRRAVQSVAAGWTWDDYGERLARFLSSPNGAAAN